MTVNIRDTVSAAPISKLACVSGCVPSCTRWKGPCVYGCKREMKGGIIPHKEACTELQKKAKQ
jgi:hypothetical protein